MCFFQTVGEAVPGERRIWKIAKDPKTTSSVMPGNEVFFLRLSVCTVTFLFHASSTSYLSVEGLKSMLASQSRHLSCQNHYILLMEGENENSDETSGSVSHVLSSCVCPCRLMMGRMT